MYEIIRIWKIKVYRKRLNIKNQRKFSPDKKKYKYIEKRNE